ncbi:unnamed protein product, partial [Meganyctiphanes norvegica]
MKPLLTLILLVLGTQGAPHSPDDYFGQEEADYDYYYGDDTDLGTMDDDSNLNMLSFNVGLIRSHRREGEDNKNQDTVTSERLIQEIDARGSNITIHDSTIDRIDARDGRLNVHTSDTIIINGDPATSTEPPVVTTELPLPEPAPVAAALESTEPSLPVTEEPDSEPEDTEISEDTGISEDTVVREDDLDFTNTFMEQLQGLQSGMEAVVVILKEIAGKVGCANAVSAKVQRSTQCPPPFHLVRPNDCLFLSLANKVTWASAQQICSSLGADLVHPKLDGQGMDFILGITHYTSAPTETVWVGASDRRQEGVWTWVNGVVTPSNLPWGPGHPKSNNGREDCMAIPLSQPLGVQASNCMRKKPFICQKEYVKK